MNLLAYSEPRNQNLKLSNHENCYWKNVEHLRRDDQQWLIQQVSSNVGSNPPRNIQLDLSFRKMRQHGKEQTHRYRLLELGPSQYLIWAMHWYQSFLSLNCPSRAWAGEAYIPLTTGGWPIPPKKKLKRLLWALKKPAKAKSDDLIYLSPPEFAAFQRTIRLTSCILLRLGWASLRSALPMDATETVTFAKG
jgi:hypothetical protein